MISNDSTIKLSYSNNRTDSISDSEQNKNSSTTIKTTTVEHNIGDNSANLPDYLSSIIDELPNNETREKLKNIYLNQYNELTDSQLTIENASREVNEIREKLKKTEMELKNIRSATNLLITDQDDILSTMKRHYDEELASLLTITKQNLLNYQPIEKSNNSTFINLNETNAYASVNSQNSNSSQLVDQNYMQNIANQAKDKLEKVVRQGSINLKAFANQIIPNKSNSSETSTDITVQKWIEKERLQNLIESYESEIGRLRQIIERAGINTSTSESQPDSPASHKSDQRSSSDNLNFNDKPNQLSTLSAPSTPISNWELNKLRSSNPVTTNSDQVLSDNANSRIKSKTKRAVCNRLDSYEHEGETRSEQSSEDLEKRLIVLTTELDKKTHTLFKAIERQSELENEIKNQALEQTDRLNKLDSLINQISARLDAFLTNSQSHRNAIEKEVIILKSERNKAQDDLETLRSHYDALVGRRSRAARELSDQPIQLPSDRADLELLALRLYEENLSFREAREHLDDRLRSEIQFHRQQLLAEQQQRVTIESSLQNELNDARKRLVNLADIITERDNQTQARDKYEQKAKLYKEKFTELNVKYEASEANVQELQSRINSLQEQVIRLQTDLDNVESVQADFVRLSQSLQVQLERLREQDHEVRWVHPDDVTSCFGCNSSFPTGPLAGSRKINCRHCGKVHCAHCMKNSVPAGPFGHAALVCDVCYTLLNKHVAPYFSIASNNNNNNNNNNNLREESKSPKRFSFSTTLSQSPSNSSTTLLTKPT